MHPDLLAAAAQCPEPEAVRARLGRLEAAGAPLDAPGLAATLVPVLANSRFLGDYLARHPEDVRLLAEPGGLLAPLSEATLGAWYAEHAGPDADEATVAAALRRTKHRAFLRITARDVALRTPVPEICAELSTVAEVAIDLAAAAARRLVAARHGPAVGPGGEPLRFVVVGMGKLGGRELNYSSDVDLLYFYDRDEGHAGALTPHQHFTRVSETITRLLGEVTADGFVFRVDLRLRPEGQSGPLCNSLGSAERYYEAWGRTWERIAWLRARPVGGDHALGHELLARLEPWIYRRSMDLDTLDAIADLKRQTQRRRQAAVALGRATGVDLKLDRGGIRAVEFFVNALQLLYAGRNPALRDPSTLGALDRLYAAGLLNDADHDRLAAAYLLYRRIEHRLQMEDERQTQRLPVGPRLDALARRLGFEGPRPGASLLAGVDAHRREVGAMFDDLLAVSAGPEERDAIAPEARLLLSPDATTAERVEICRQAGLTDPEQAVHLLDVAGRHPESPLSPRASARMADLGLRLLTEVLRSAAPERALTHLTAFLSVVGPRRLYLDTLRERPAVARLLVSVFADSDFLSDALLRQPELIDDLYGRPPVQTDRAAFRSALDAATARVDPGDVEAWLNAVGGFKQRETLRIGLADLAGELDHLGVEAALTGLAEAVLAAVVERAEALVAARHGRPEDASFCVLGLGKLGGRELSYGSDLDLVFLYDRDGTTAGPRPLSHLEWFTRLAQRTISLLSLPTRVGALYAVDTRLRPAGGQGTLVTRLARFEAWHRTHAGGWERLALVRARPVAGDPALCDTVADCLRRLTYERPPPPGLEAEIRRLRARMLAEVAREGPGRYNPKAGRGGLVEIELVVQLLQIRFGRENPALRTTNTVRALEALREAGVLADGDVPDVLIEAHRFLRRLDHRLRIARGQPAVELRTDRPSRDRVARRLGYRRDPLAHDGGEPGDRLLEDYRRMTDHVRELYERLIPETGGEDGAESR